MNWIFHTMDFKWFDWSHHLP